MKICKHAPCSKPFDALKTKRVYCCAGCAYEQKKLNERRKKAAPKICAFDGCAKLFDASQTRRVYCSTRCFDDQRNLRERGGRAEKARYIRQVVFECLDCQKSLDGLHPNSRYCNAVCRAAHRKTTRRREPLCEDCKRFVKRGGTRFCGPCLQTHRVVDSSLWRHRKKPTALVGYAARMRQSLWV